MNIAYHKFNKILLAIGTFFICYGIAYPQESNHAFQNRSLNTTNTGMLVLGGWAVANLAMGSYGWARAEGKQKYFHQMNFLWNTVNISIAGIALYSNYNSDPSLYNAQEILAQHIKTERTLLINSVLDLGYIGTGFLLKHMGTRSEKRQSILTGYGNSLLLQGTFLLVFDLSLFGILYHQRLDYIESISLNMFDGYPGFQLILNL
jgi:hypothetical protein